jgi:hypothetical protein
MVVIRMVIFKLKMLNSSLKTKPLKAISSKILGIIPTDTMVKNNGEEEKIKS